MGTDTGLTTAGTDPDRCYLHTKKLDYFLDVDGTSINIAERFKIFRIPFGRSKLCQLLHTNKKINSKGNEY